MSGVISFIINNLINNHVLNLSIECINYCLLHSIVMILSYKLYSMMTRTDRYHCYDNDIIIVMIVPLMIYHAAAAPLHSTHDYY